MDKDKYMIYIRVGILCEVHVSTSALILSVRFDIL
jgi:hypothetical protein